MEAQYLKNNHVTYYVITQVGVYAAQQWYVLRPTWRGTATHPPGRTDKVLEAGVQTSYVHSSRNIVLPSSHPSPPSLPSLPPLSLPPSLPLVTQQIHCPFQPKQSPSTVYVSEQNWQVRVLWFLHVDSW